MSIRDKLIRNAFYQIRPAVPRRLQITLRRLLVPMAVRKYRDIWPINVKAGTKPAGVERLAL
jgi:hypothetical protein